MGMSRADNVDNRKHGPATTKAQASQPAQWRQSMGEWDAPGQQLVTDTDANGIDDTTERIAMRSGFQSEDPVTP
jgi:hypothetical protein